MRITFAIHMIVYMAVMLIILLSLQARLYTLVVIWTLFVYIIIKEFIDEFRAERRRIECEKERARIAGVMQKLDKMKKDIQGTV